MNNLKEILQIKKELGLIEFDKKEIKQELLGKNFTNEDAQLWIDKYKYYRLMFDGTKMFYSEEYIVSHSINELEAIFQKIN